MSLKTVIGEIIKDVREKSKLSQADLAQLLKVSNSYVSYLETGKKNSSVQELDKIFDVLDIDFFDYFKDKINKDAYSSLHGYFLKKILLDNERWYLPDSGLWGERYLSEHKDILTEHRTLCEIDFILKFMPKKKAVSILDACCGHGRISNKLAEKKFNVTGVDINPLFVKIARENSENIPSKPLYIVEDILNFKSNKKFNLVLSMFTSIGYFESEEKNELHLKKICELTEEKGRLIIETINPIGLLRNYRSLEKNSTDDGILIVQERFFDYLTSTNIERITDYYPDGNIFKGIHRIRLYYPHELIKVCSGCGLKNVGVYDSEGSNDNLIDSIRMWLVFEKER